MLQGLNRSRVGTVALIQFDELLASSLEAWLWVCLAKS